MNHDRCALGETSHAAVAGQFESSANVTLRSCGVAHTIDALEREWPVTNCLDGFTGGTAVKPNTRSHYGLLLGRLPAPFGTPTWTYALTHALP